MSSRRESVFKEFVAVLAVHWQDGKTTPYRFQRENGETVHIDRVLNTQKAATLKAGGCGIRYTCRVTDRATGRETQIYLFDDDGYWFIEKANEEDIVCVDGTILTLTGKRCKT